MGTMGNGDCICDDGTFLEGIDTCTVCPSGCTTCTGETSCTSCAPDLDLINGGCEKITNGCFEFGPNIQCPEDITLTTNTLCAVGSQCVIAPEVPPVTCTDNTGCACSVEQLSGFSGDMVVGGESHPFQFQATNDAGFSFTCH